MILIDMLDLKFTIKYTFVLIISLMIVYLLCFDMTRTASD